MRPLFDRRESKVTRAALSADPSVVGVLIDSRRRVRFGSPSRKAADRMDKAIGAVETLLAAAEELREAYRELPSTDYPQQVRQEAEERIGRAHHALELSIAGMRWASHG